MGWWPVTVIVMTEEAASRFHDDEDMRVAYRARKKVLITCFYQWLEDIPIAWWIYMDPEYGEYWAVQHDFNWEAGAHPDEPHIGVGYEPDEPIEEEEEEDDPPDYD